MEFAHSFDKALPEKHNLALYNGKTQTKTATLGQVRSGMCKLNKYIARSGTIETATCSCGCESESVDQFFFYLDALYG